MAIMTGMDCIHCEKERARHGSHYCSAKCERAFMKKSKGPVQCIHCDAETETVNEARKAGWKRVSADPEGISYNYTGYCQDHLDWA